MKPSFYYVDSDYINFLKNKEIEHRGFTTIPNVDYTHRTKFVYGVVMQIKDLNYFVPVTSYNKRKEDNILIKITQQKKLISVGSLRFNYMFPVPKFCLSPVNFNDSLFSESYKAFLIKEYHYIKKKIGLAIIQKQAHKTYQKVLSGEDKELLHNSCSFLLLEEACKEYIRNTPQKHKKPYEPFDP